MAFCNPKECKSFKLVKNILSYDNMCHLDGMKASRSPLPFPSPWDKAWTSVTKIIDSLHINNHKDESCREKYDPSVLKKKFRKEIRWQLNKRLFGCLASKKYCVPCQKCITCSTSIVWLSTEIGILLHVTNMERSLCYQRHATKKCKESTPTGNIKVLFYYVYAILSVEFVNSMHSVFSLQPGIHH